MQINYTQEERYLKAHPLSKHQRNQRILHPYDCFRDDYSLSDLYQPPIFDRNSFTGFGSLYLG